MTQTQRKSIRQACEVVLGAVTVERLEGGRVPLPRIVDMAIRHAFIYMYNPRGVSCEVLRAAATEFDI